MFMKLLNSLKMYLVAGNDVFLLKIDRFIRPVTIFTSIYVLFNIFEFTA